MELPTPLWIFCIFILFFVFAFIIALISTFIYIKHKSKRIKKYSFNYPLEKALKSDKHFNPNPPSRSKFKEK